MSFPMMSLFEGAKSIRTPPRVNDALKNLGALYTYAHRDPFSVTGAVAGWVLLSSDTLAFSRCTSLSSRNLHFCTT